MLTLLAKILKVLNSDDSPAQIAAAVVLAAFMGLTPLFSAHNAILLLLVLVLRVNLSLFLVSFALFTAVGYLIDPLSHRLGLSLLQSDALNALWTAMYNVDLWRVLAFNNTLVIGSFALSAILAVPLFFLVIVLVRNYRERLRERVLKSRFMMAIKGSTFYSVYSSLHG